ncbi:UPF0643 protein [Fulvia fulva]|uniref:UPF0643 protein n=1 Tax=Passalora fulva TaxID=5499 RepID=A0A9Q8USD1_PASFU|nr:UPF0643 protein [Fulvia fulva]KAK4618143.1 UPF0643 protein [Fulvia fulva]KAK4618932.1 UPF0643 protein [Fulvia fulva]UJO20709.1 UPF0643 protein [Fulvia fulva]WPV18578.1 UPF0643 protein [Fulvia fulva]WPV33501.1 UPF0643 protein [Fulvia fulva]
MIAHREHRNGGHDRLVAITTEKSQVQHVMLLYARLPFLLPPLFHTADRPGVSTSNFGTSHRNGAINFTSCVCRQKVKHERSRFDHNTPIFLVTMGKVLALYHYDTYEPPPTYRKDWPQQRDTTVVESTRSPTEKATHDLHRQCTAVRKMAAVATQLSPEIPVGKDHYAAASTIVRTSIDSNPGHITTDTSNLEAGSHIDLNATHLISSPYPDFENQLRLADVDIPYQLFAFALTALKQIRPDYATAPYLESFNWSEVFALLRTLCKQAGYQWEGRQFYVVIFRSKLQVGIDRERLGLLDQMSHQEACASGGLLKYWFGSTDGERRNLATCLWRNHEDAVAGGGGPWHKQARMAARTMYEYIDFGVHQMVVGAGAESWHMEDCKR